MRRPAVLITLLCCLCLSLAASGKGQEAWPSFRGPLGTGVAPQADPPVEWSETKNVVWKVPLPGEGDSTPIIWEDRIYLLTAVKVETPAAPAAAPPPSDAAVEPARQESRPRLQTGTPRAPDDPPPPQQQQRPSRPPRPRPTHTYEFTVMALDRATGKTAWSTVVAEEIPHEPGHETASQASATPVTDGQRLYAFFGSRGLHALDLNGKVLWKVDLGDMKTRNEFGEGSSPVIHEDAVLVNWDHEGEDFLVALDKGTGKERWRVARDEPTSWSTPLVIQDGGRALAVVSATQRVRAYDVKTGVEAWNLPGLGKNCIPTPVAANGIVYVMSGYQEPAGMAIRYEGAEGDISSTDRVAWRLDRGTSYVASPLLYDGKLYFVDRLSAVLSSMELTSGRPHYREQRLEGLSNIYASPVGAKGRIYLIDRGGTAAVIRHGETFELIATNKLDDSFDASPVIAGDRIYLRGHKSLYCIGKG